ncbi:MAG: ABC transporter ATP-binding protein [Clostridia bacterium]|nr:ABC transporter ATP-binding protein [Clostridia bacterium]
MLPVDFFGEIELAYFKEKGVSIDSCLAALHLDFDTAGNFGDVWLVIDKDRNVLCRLDLSLEKYDEFSLEELLAPYIDNYNTTNALLAYKAVSPLPFADKTGDGTYSDRVKEAAADATTTVVGYCTNACKQKLFAFVHIWDKFVRGETVTEDDSIFEQFRAKCPKCGKVYEDQHRRICADCTNKKGLVPRVMAYFKPYVVHLILIVLCLVITSGISLLTPILSGQLLYDQVISKSDPNVKAEFGDEVLLNDGGAGAILESLTHKLYYYYEKSPDGKFVYSETDKGGEYVHWDGKDESVVRYTLRLTDDKNEYEGALQVTGRLEDVKYVYIVVGLIVLLAVMSLSVSIFSSRINDEMSMSISRNMKNDIFKAMSALSVSYFNKNPTGKLMNRVTYDAVVVKDFCTSGLPYIFTNVFTFIGLAIFLFSVNVKLTLIVFIPIPIIFILFKFMLPKLMKTFSMRWRASSAMSGMLGDVLNGARVVKAFAKEDNETSRFIKYADRMYKANLKVNLVWLMIFPVVSLLMGIAAQSIWGFGGILVMGGSMTYGELTAYLGYLSMIFAPIEFFSNFTNMVTDTMNSAQRMFEVIDTVPEVAEAKDAVSAENIKGDIVFENVCFHYTPNRPILKDVSFKINRGEHIGLVGHTGSGKSTIANLITRMYDVVSGSVTIDGINVKDLEMKSLRRNIAIVSQEVFIFGGTIAENIKYGKPEATMDEIIAASKAANAHDFIMRLPEGYETLVGIGSRSLSGGERQRVSIARALLLSPAILILDEATAAMDNETERQISEAIDKLVEGRTTISIAHRLSTLKNCDYIMAIEHGRLEEMGTKEELLEKKGVYYKLYTLQNDQMNQVMQGL